ncbi:MAG: (d)CMP kinase [Eubacteriales bacterium]|nr:(d)CMP kinase [Eubacteriales bacterium]
MCAKSIALDGPAGVGKSTIAKAVAKELDLIYIDTGAMFRGLSVYITDNKCDPDDRGSVAELIKNVEVKISYVEGLQHVILNGEDITDRLRTEEISQVASVISQYPEVRKKLLDLQRKMAESEDVIMDGRDIGTVVLPNADLKIFLTADPKIRAERRFKQLEEQGKRGNLTVEDIQNEMILRDKRDAERKEAPLVKAEDAVLVDTSYMDIEAVQNEIIKLFRSI